MGDHECSQEQIIGEITATIRYFQDAEKRRETREERMASAMEMIAAHGKVIEAHAESLTRHEKSITILYERVREIEKEPAQDAKAVQFGTINAVISAVVAGIVTWVSGK